MFSVAVLLLLLAAGSGVKCEQLTQPASLTIRPGQPLTIRCQVSYSVGSYYTAWIRQPDGSGLEWIGIIYTGGKYQKDSLSSKFSLAVDSSSTPNTATLQGQNMQPGDSAVYYCARQPILYSGYSVDYWGKGTVVTVSNSEEVQAPHVLPLVQCGSLTGDITLGCLATGATPASLTLKWTAEGKALPGAVQYPTSKKGNTYTGVSQISVRRQDWDARKTYTCSAGNVDATLQKIVVHRQLPTLSILISTDEEIKNTGKASFSCLANDFSPKDYTITWLRNGVKIDEPQISTFSESKKTKDGTLYNAVSYIQMNESRWKDVNTVITCMFASDNSVNASVTYTPEGGDSELTLVEINILPIDLPSMYLKKKADLVCSVDVQGNADVDVKWVDENDAEPQQKSVRGNPKTATVMISYDEWSKGLRWSCVATIKDSINPPVRKYFEKNNGPNIVQPSVYLLPPVDDLKCTNMTLTCFVKDFYPKDVLVHWLVDDEKVDGNDYYSYKTTNVVENDNLFSTYGQLTFSSDSWKNGTVFSCVVYHESDTQNKPTVKLITERASGNVNIINMNMCPSQPCMSS